MLLEGIFLPLTTPFHADGRLFLKKLESNVARYSLTPAQGMMVLGREGEGDALTDAETREVLRTAIGAAADEKVMIARGTRRSVSAALGFAETAAELGYDAVALREPFGLGPSYRQEAKLFFEAVADRSPLPIVIEAEIREAWLYEVIGEVAQHPQILGAIYSELPISAALAAQLTSMPFTELRKLLETTASVKREVVVTNIFAAVTGRMLRHAAPAQNFISAASLGGTATLAAPAGPGLKTRTKRVGFQILAGPTASMLEAWGVGATGAVPRLSACAPQVCCEVWQAFKDGDPALAAEKQERIRCAAEMVEGCDDKLALHAMRRGIAAVKYACDLNGYYGGRPRLPMMPLTGEKRDAMETLMAGLKN